MSCLKTNFLLLAYINIATGYAFMLTIMDMQQEYKLHRTSFR